jgi:hypothetical protein
MGLLAAPVGHVCCIVLAADVQDRDGGLLLLATLFGKFQVSIPRETVCRFADSAYQCPFLPTGSPKSWPISKPKSSNDPTAHHIRARSTRLAGSVRDCAIDLNFAYPHLQATIQSPAAALPRSSIRSPVGTRDICRKPKRIPSLMTTFMESVV